MEYVKRVLVVDDEQDFVDMIKMNLESLDSAYYEVMGITDPAQVVSAIRSFKPNVILLDILMPPPDGFEVCRILSEDPVGKGIPIVIISALGDDVNKIKAFQLRVVEYLVKPAELKDIVSALEKAGDAKMVI